MKTVKEGDIFQFEYTNKGHTFLVVVLTVTKYGWLNYTTVDDEWIPNGVGEIHQLGISQFLNDNAFISRIGNIYEQNQVATTKENVKFCICNKYDVYNYGCKCGAIKPYQMKVS